MSLSILSYNCHLFGNFFIYQYLDLYYYDEIRCNKIIFNLLNSDLDIICLQEVWSDKLLSFIISKMKNKYFFFRPNVNCGLIIFSKYKITLSYFKKFKNSEFPDSLVSKGFGMITILFQNKYIDIYFTHTQAIYSNKLNKIAIKNLHEIYNRVKKSKNKRIICGDLNINMNIVKNIFKNFNFSNINNSCSISNTLFSKFQKDCCEGKLDYILFDNSFQLEESLCCYNIRTNNNNLIFKINNIDCSDHYPLYSKFK